MRVEGKEEGWLEEGTGCTIRQRELHKAKPVQTPLRKHKQTGTNCGFTCIGSTDVRVLSTQTWDTCGTRAPCTHMNSAVPSCCMQDADPGSLPTYRNFLNVVHLRQATCGLGRTCSTVQTAVFGRASASSLDQSSSTHPQSSTAS